MGKREMYGSECTQIPQIPRHIYVGWLRRHYATGRCLCWSRL